MKIALVNLTGGGFSGGYLKYLRELVPALKRQAGVKELFVFLPPAFISLLDKKSAPGAVFPCVDTVRGRRELHKIIRQLAPDIVFFPTYRWLDLAPIPTVSMIRNMEPLLSPWGGNRLVDVAKNLLRAYSARTACRRASRVIAVSRFVKDFLVRSWRIPPAKIGVVSHGVAEPPGAKDLPRPAGLKPEWKGRFCFAAGSIRPYRGLEDIIEALGKLAAKGLRYPLVIAGATTSLKCPYQRKIEALARKEGVAGQIYWAGQLSDAEMAWCYYHCMIFLMTSRIEACPNIALEALSHGCLCVSADNPPLPEFFGKAASYYQPRQAESLAGAITAALNLIPAELEQMRTLARNQARKVTWENTAEQTLREFRLAIAN